MMVNYRFDRFSKRYSENHIDGTADRNGPCADNEVKWRRNRLVNEFKWKVQRRGRAGGDATSHEGWLGSASCGGPLWRKETGSPRGFWRPEANILRGPQIG